MRRITIEGVRNPDKECWEIYCPICGVIIRKRFLVDDKICSCGWNWKAIADDNFKVAVVRLEGN